MIAQGKFAENAALGYFLSGLQPFQFSVIREIRVSFLKIVLL